MKAVTMPTMNTGVRGPSSKWLSSPQFFTNSRTVRISY